MSPDNHRPVDVILTGDNQQLKPTVLAKWHSRDGADVIRRVE